jgi:hypothetical protein
MTLFLAKGQHGPVEGQMRSSLKLAITAHLTVRMRQRGYRVDDFATIERLGTDTSGGVLLRKKDVRAELMKLSEERRSIRKHKEPDRYAEQEIIRKLESARKLEGTYIPTESGCALSIYRPSSRRMKYILHGRSRRSRRQTKWFR